MLSELQLELSRRLMSRVHAPDGPTGCWLWTGAIMSEGYGSIGDGDGAIELTHRLAWKLWIGELGDLTVDHRCQQKLCFNPAHLVAVSREVNAARGEGFSPLYCLEGHPIFGALGQWRWKREKRRCMVCHKRREREAYARGGRRKRPGKSRVSYER